VPLLALLTLAHVLVDTYATIVPALLPFWQARFQLSYGLAGLITGIANVTSSVAQPLVGMLTDRGRHPRWLAIACLVAAAGISATGLAASYPLFLALVVCGGLGVSSFHPQGYKLVGLHSGRRQAAATSWFLVGGNLGVALGPLVGTAAVLRFGLPGTALLLLPGAALAAVLWWLVPRWTRAEASGQRVGGAALGRDGRWRAPTGDTTDSARVLPAPSAAPPMVPPVVAGLSMGRRMAAIALLVAAVAVRSTVTSSLASFIPLYYVRVAGMSEAFASRVLAGTLLSGAAATIAGGYLADRWGRLRTIGATLLPVPALLLAFLAAPPDSPATLAALWAAGALVTASFSITVVLAQDLWYERRALASGVIVGFAFGTGGLFVPLVGALADRWGLAAGLRLVALLPLVSLLLFGLLAALLERPRPAAPAG
jgi:FSR family fosmidomycin resistance protein-like MFS transporter